MVWGLLLLKWKKKGLMEWKLDKQYHHHHQLVFVKSQSTFCIWIVKTTNINRIDFDTKKPKMSLWFFSTIFLCSNRSKTMNACCPSFKPKNQNSLFKIYFIHIYFIWKIYVVIFFLSCISCFLVCAFLKINIFIFFKKNNNTKEFPFLKLNKFMSKI